MDRRLIVSSLIGVHVLLATLSFRQSVSAAPPPTPVAEIQAILIGGVPEPEVNDVTKLEIKRAEDGRLEAGTVGSPLFARDEIRTGAGVEVNLTFARPDAWIEVFVLEQSRAAIGSLFSFYGSFLVRGFGIFNTQTSYVRLGKRGTEFKVDVYENGDVDLTVLLGAVDVEKGDFAPGSQARNASRDQRDIFVNASFTNPAEVKSVLGRQTVRITRQDPIPEPRLLAEREVIQLLDRTNNLLLATMPQSRPTNVLPTTFTASLNDPGEDKRRADAAFKAARRNAVLEPSVKNTVALGDAFKDLGSGERASMEYAHASKVDPALNRSADFLISQAEAFRLDRNYSKADENLKKARGLMVPATPRSTQFKFQIAAANNSYDKAVTSVNLKKNREALEYFKASKSEYERAGELVPISDIGGGSSVFVFRSAMNVNLALKSDPTIDAHTALNGTYDGELSYAAAGAVGPAVLVVTGTRFTLSTKKISLTGTVTTRGGTANGKYAFDFVFDSGAALGAVALEAFCSHSKSLVLRSVPTEKVSFQFLGQPRQVGLTCLQPERSRHVVTPL